jgi:hypothetical protein
MDRSGLRDRFGWSMRMEKNGIWLENRPFPFAVVAGQPISHFATEPIPKLDFKRQKLPLQKQTRKSLELQRQIGTRAWPVGVLGGILKGQGF